MKSPEINASQEKSKFPKGNHMKCMKIKRDQDRPKPITEIKDAQRTSKEIKHMRCLEAKPVLQPHRGL